MSATVEFVEAVGREARVQTPSKLDVFAVSIPARTFTGDFYSYARTRDGGLVLSVGDVAGKGLRAAVFMAMIHEELERLNAPDAEACHVLRSLNQLLRAQMPRNRFATMVTVKISPTGEAHVVNAGHWPVLIRRASGEVEQIRANGAALALFETACWKGESVRLHRGDFLVAYTDGLIEAATPSGEEFGLDRLAEEIESSDPDSPQAVVEEVLDVAHRFAGAWSDDVTVAAVQII